MTLFLLVILVAVLFGGGGAYGYGRYGLPGGIVPVLLLILVIWLLLGPYARF